MQSPSDKILTINQALLKDFAIAARDPNLIHLDDTVAKANGLPGVIAHGMLLAARLTSFVTFKVQEQYSVNPVLNHCRFRFKAMTFLDEEIFGTYEVASTENDQITIESIAKNGFGEIKLEAKFLFYMGGK